MSGYVITGYLVTTTVVASYIGWVLSRTRAVKRSLDIDLRDLDH